VVNDYFYRVAKVGQTVKFPCPTKLEEDVDWKQPVPSGSYIYLGNVGYHDLGKQPKFAVLGRNQSYSLVIYNVTVDDTGTYQCIEEGGHGNSRDYLLTVIGVLTIRFFLQWVFSVNLVAIFSTALLLIVAVVV